VVGVVRNERRSSPVDDPEPTVYVPLETADLTQVTILLRAADPLAAKRALSAAAAAAYPTLAPRPLATLEEIRLQQYVSVRWMASAFSAIGTLALILAVVGLFAMVSAAVAQRTREFGVRIALGAQPAAVIAMVLREVLTVTSVGLLAGLVLSVPMSFIVRDAFVRDATLADPAGVAAGLTVMLGAIVMAACIPARRAARVDPLLALRAD
jgi:ABC-type lipoprotein release transport system permease subunit